ncbi:MAG: hypothetical protein IJZ39_10390 [Oscillospiraceae bacterium]|nr:hypothetical protein [Oscillospiraceae bacterium]
MRRIMSLLMALMLLASLLCACGGDPATETNPPENNVSENNEAETNGSNNGAEDPDAGSAETKEIVVSDYLADDSKWEDDGGYHERDESKLYFDNYMAGDYCAVRLTEEAQNVTYKFDLTISQLAEVSMEDFTWWDSELLIIARSAIPAASWYDDGTQTGYTLTSWGDMSTVFIGRAGYDDAFGEFEWNVNDGQPHAVELSVVNNEDNTAVTITLVVDGVEIASVVDDGTLIKNERPGMYPDAGGLTIRCKWLEATIE